jgi:hypothetical protein
LISDFNSAFSICFLMNLLDPPSLLFVQFAVLYLEIRTFIYCIRKSKSYFKKTSFEIFKTESFLTYCFYIYFKLILKKTYLCTVLSVPFYFMTQKLIKFNTVLLYPFTVTFSSIIKGKKVWCETESKTNYVCDE